MTSLHSLSKPPEPRLGELTASQSLYAGSGETAAGVYGWPLANLAGFGSAYAPSPSAAAWPALGPAYAAPLAAALLGSGALEGANRYAAPLAGVGLPAVLPGYSRPWPGTYATYRVMSAHPTLVLAGAAVMAPVLSAGWSVQASKDAPAGARDFIDALFSPLRVGLLLECLKALVFGWRGFEKVYELRAGYLTLRRLKPLLPELTTILVDAKGHLAGLKQTALTNDDNSSNSSKSSEITLPAEKVFVYSYDRDGDDYYGRSRHENCRRAWSNWLCDDDHLGRLAAKVSSIIPQVGYPPGRGLDEHGREQSNYQTALAVAQGMAAGRPVVMPNLAGLTLDDLTRLPELAQASLWHLGTLDVGNPGPAQAALLQQLHYRDALLVRGWMRPERSLLEASRAGSRADAAEHADIGLCDSELVHADIVRQLNRHVVDDLLALNFGEEARGRVWIAPVALADEKKLIDSALLQGILRNPRALFELISRLDMTAWLDRSGLPRADAAKPWPAA